MSDFAQTKPPVLAAPISEETSKRITSLRFLLSVFVVFIHNGITINVSDPDVFEVSFNAINRWIQFFISQGIARSAVPLFFMFAAYLQFKKKDSYKTLVKKRTQSLVVPLFLWISINIIAVIALKLFAQTFFPSSFNNTDSVLFFSKYSLLDWAKAFLGDYSDLLHGYWFPYVMQFWFVRDLFIMMLISPVLTVAARKFPWETLVFAAFFAISGLRPVIVEPQAFLFYILGFYWAEKDFDLFAFADKCKWRTVIPLFAMFTILKFINDGIGGIYFLTILSGMLVILKLSGVLIQNKHIFAVTKWLAGFSFFLYAIHEGFMKKVIRSLWLNIFPLKNSLSCLLAYFGITLLIVILGTLIGIVLKKICPRLFSLLTGGR